MSSRPVDVQKNVKRVLLIAYHYPPCGTSSGQQRTLCFSRDLQDCSWSSLVLTVNPRAYAVTKMDQLGQIPPKVPVRRAFALDTTRHLGIGGRYLGWLALPDPWVSWLLGAIPAGLRMIRKHRPQILWSTYPIATAHLIGLALHRLTGIPWVADFRDPMTEIDPVTQQQYPTDPRVWKARRWVERQTLKYCSRAVFVTPGSLRIHQERYPRLAGRMTVIANGYDEENFAAAERSPRAAPIKRDRLLLLHSGILYPGPDRDPTAFFAAIARLWQLQKISGENLQIRLRASGSEDYYRRLIRDYALEDMVSIEPPIPYQEALAEMLSADGLLVFQGRTSNPAVPAKLYEYLRARRPIFALVDHEGDTAVVLRNANVGTLVPLDDRQKIAEGLVDFLAQIQQGTAPLPSFAEAEHHSRKSKAKELATLLDVVVREAGMTGNSVAASERET
jgi:glycosyltransferase involved in cell wall biosynthesis